jgi:deazaflavin-dependent oxidoreductase (nitroreductase family)
VVALDWPPADDRVKVIVMTWLLTTARRGLRGAWPRVHLWVYRRTDGRVGSRFGRLEQVLLTTRGRRSGQLRTTPLAGVPDGDRLLLVASNWGQEHNPHWLHNLVANPDVVVQRGRQIVAMRARVASDEEREGLWPVVVRAHHGFETYAGRSSRQIPLVICEPVAGAGPE